MTDGDNTSPHAGSFYQVRLNLDYVTWFLSSIPGRLGLLGTRAGEFPETVPGMDISHWQGSLTKEWWSAAFAEGFRFVFLKATEGRTFTDPAYEVNKANAREAGFKFGAYHFARPQFSGEEQAEFFEGVAGDLDIGGVWDLEYAGGMSGTVINVRTEEFLSALNERYGYSWMYGAAWFLDPRKINPQVPYYRWVAHWTAAASPYLPRIWRDREYDAWQYSSRGRVAGKRGTDLNRMQKKVFEKLVGG